jgi:hydrogenase maturation protein HypF
MAAVLALGAALKNTACLRQDGRDGAAVRWSALHGGLDRPEACAALDASAEALLAHAGGRVDALAHDLHPEVHSTRLARLLAERLGVPAVPVQHHVAHVAVPLAEASDDEPVIGLALDDGALGADGTLWGGEVFCLFRGCAARVAHLQPIAMPGGGLAVREPWRLAAAALHALGRGDEIELRYLDLVGAERARVIARMLVRAADCPPTTSAARWFDAAAAALGVQLRQIHPAEAATALEQLARQWLDTHRAPEPAPWVVIEGPCIVLLPLIEHLFELGARGAVGEGAALFHLVLAAALARAVGQAAADVDAFEVTLGGGCFHNHLLSEELATRLSRRALDVRRPSSVDCGDAGLALGQAWIAAQQLAHDRTASAAKPPEDRPCV